MQGDNFKPVSPETAAWALQQFAALSGQPQQPATAFNGYRVGRPHTVQSRAKQGRSRIENWCQRVGISTDERIEYIKLKASTGLTAAEALRVIKGARKA